MGYIKCPACGGPNNYLCNKCHGDGKYWVDNGKPSVEVEPPSWYQAEKEWERRKR